MNIRVKRATFTFRSDKISLKMPKQIYQSDILKLQKIQNFTNKNVLFYVGCYFRVPIGRFEK